MSYRYHLTPIPYPFEPEIENFIAKLAKEQKKNISEIVNMLLFKDKELMELMRTE